MVLIALGSYWFWRAPPRPSANAVVVIPCPSPNAVLVMTIPIEAADTLLGKRHEIQMELDGVKRSCGFGPPSHSSDCSFEDGSDRSLFAYVVPGRPEHAVVRLLTNGVVEFAGERSTSYDSRACPPVIDMRLRPVGEHPWF